MHCCVIAILPIKEIAPERGDPEEGEALDSWVGGWASEALGPYDENLEVGEYEEECYCRGSRARDEVNRIAVAKYGDYREMQEPFTRKHGSGWRKDEKLFAKWQQLVQEREDAIRALLAAHPDVDKFDPECESCEGAGIKSTTRNPNGHWDWFSVGGRWHGVLVPARDT